MANEQRAGLARRVRRIREELYGERGGPEMAGMLGLPEQAWRNFERGAMLPAEFVLRFLDLTRVSPHWLLTGEGERFT